MFTAISCITAKWYDLLENILIPAYIPPQKK
jgi:hypothetical protein